MTVANLSWHDLGGLLMSVGVAYLLALPLGWERKAKSVVDVGFRVFPLVAVSSCVYVTLGQHIFAGAASREQSDVLQGLMTGVGFIGGGAIVKEAHEPHGLATAAAIWTTAALGAAVGYGYYVLALALCLMSLVILDVMPRIGRPAQDANASSPHASGDEPPP